MNKDVEESLLTADELISAVRGCIAGKKTVCFSSVATDSRNVKSGSMFVPLVGEFQDGHKYIAGAVEKGASVVLAVEENWLHLTDEDRSSILDKASVVFVDNTLYALQSAAAAYVKKFPDLIRIGITGSNGKTTTKEIAASVLSKHFRVIATEGNFNSETGLPLSVFNIRREHEAGIFEMGMNRKDEILELAGVLCPSFGIITNIGTAHIGILGSKDNIAEEKKKIFSRFTDDCTGFVPENDEYAAFLSAVDEGRVQLFGPESQKNITEVASRGMDGTSFCYCGVPVHFLLPGQYNFMNMLSVVALAEKLGLTESEIRTGIEDVKPLFGRSRILKGKYTVVQDCYNANAESMKEALRFYGKEDCAGKKIFVLGDMLELGDCSGEIHSETGELAAIQNPHAVFFVGKEMVRAYETACEVAKKNNLSVMLCSEPSVDDESVAKVTDRILGMAGEGDVILVKGSRGMRLERVVDVLCREGGMKS